MIVNGIRTSSSIGPQPHATYSGGYVFCTAACCSRCCQHGDELVYELPGLFFEYVYTPSSSASGRGRGEERGREARQGASWERRAL